MGTFSLGAGADKVVQAKDSSVAASAINIGTANIAANDTLTFANGVDIIKSFGTDDDIIKGGTAEKTTALGLATADGFTDGSTYYLSGDFAPETGVFTIKADGVGTDTLVFIANGTAFSADKLTGAVILVGVDSDNLSVSNFEAA